MTVNTSISRRQFLVGSCTAFIASALLPACSDNAAKQLIIISAKDAQNKHYAVAVDIHGYLISRVALPSRGHDALALPNKPGHALIFARSPNRFAMEVDFVTGHIAHSFTSDNDTYFNGHGAVSADGKWLYTSENHLDSNEGFIVVRDTQSYRVVDRFPSGGISPHELLLLPDEKTLVIANSGIVTPSRSSAKNAKTEHQSLLAETPSNLTYIDINNKDIVAQIAAPEYGQRIRHLDASEQGDVFIAMEYHGDNAHLPPLIYRHTLNDERKNGELKAAKFSANTLKRIQQKTASIKVLNNLLAVSCPQANCLTFFHTDSLELIEQEDYPGVAGLTTVNNLLVVSSREGKLRIYNNKVNLKYATEQNLASLYFDTHMTTIYSG